MVKARMARLLQRVVTMAAVGVHQLPPFRGLPLLLDGLRLSNLLFPLLLNLLLHTIEVGATHLLIRLLVTDPLQSNLLRPMLVATGDNNKLPLLKVQLLSKAGVPLKVSKALLLKVRRRLSNPVGVLLPLSSLRRLQLLVVGVPLLLLNPHSLPAAGAHLLLLRPTRTTTMDGVLLPLVAPDGKLSLDLQDRYQLVNLHAFFVHSLAFAGWLLQSVEARTPALHQLQKNRHLL
jgi:hypothetical protein